MNPRYKLNQLYCQAWLSHAVTSVVHWGIPDLVPAGGTGAKVEDLSVQSGLAGGPLYRTLRALASNGIFEQCDDGTFRHNDVSQLLRKDHPYSWAAMAQMWGHPVCVNAWINFRGSLTDGRSGIEHAFGKPLYDYLHEDKEACDAFAAAMISNSAEASDAIAKEFSFEKYPRVMDLGGGVGTFICAVLKEHPKIHGALFEIKDLEEGAKDYIAADELTQRCKLEIGDWFESVPPNYDLYMVKNSLWNWDDERCTTIMRNVRKAIGEALDARFLIVEYIIDLQDTDNATWTTLYDLQILNMPGGRARTKAEYERLLDKAGFAIDSVQTVLDQTLLLARPV